MKKKIGILLGVFAMVLAGSVGNAQAADRAGTYGQGTQLETRETSRFPEKTGSREGDLMRTQDVEKESRDGTFSDAFGTYRILTEGEHPTAAVIKINSFIEVDEEGNETREFSTRDPRETWYANNNGVSYAVTEMRGQDLFWGVQKVTIPEGVKVLGAKTLWGSDVEQLYLPSTLEQFDTNHALYQLEKLVVSAENPYYSSLDNVLFNKDKSELILYAPGQEQTEYELPESVKVIKFNAFYNNNYLETLYLSKVEEIKKYAFYGMKKIKDIYMGENLSSYESMLTIFQCNSLENIFVDENNNHGFFDDGGVFYFEKGKQRVMFCYPANHQEKSYAILYGTTALGTDSICDTSFTQELIIPSTCKTIGSWVVENPNIPLAFVFQHTEANDIAWDAFTCLQPGSQAIFAKEEYTKNIDEAAFMIEGEDGHLKPDPNPPISIDYERAVSRIDNWYEKDGKTYRYDESGNLLKDGIYNVWGLDYGFDEEGVICEGLVEFAGKAYYFEEGALQYLTGIQTLDGERYFFLEDFSICKDSQITDWGITYYLDSKTGKVICDSEHHQYGAWSSIEEATCLQAGLRGRTCSNCGYREEQTVPRTDHIFGSWEVKKASTCTAYGTRSHTCTVCKTIASESLPLAGHTFGAWTVTVPPSTFSDGCKVRSCSVCSRMETMNIPKLPRTGLAQAVLGKIKDRVYNGKPQNPDITVKLNGTVLKKGRDYTVTYQSNKLPGKVRITIQGMGAYTGSRTASFQILPKKPVKLKGTAANGKLTVTFPKVAKITGYQVSCSSSKKFTAKTTKMINSKKNKAVFKKRKTKKNYYVRVRAYKTFEGSRVYGGYSKTIRVRTK